MAETHPDAENVPLITRKDDELKPPADRYNAAYIIFYLLGIGCLLPWNAFIMLDAYFQKKLGASSKFEHNVLAYFSTGYQLCNILLLVFASRVVNKIPTEYRIGVPLIINFITFVAILCMVKAPITGDSFFYYTFSLVILSAATSSFFQGGLFGLASMMPFTFTQALMGGQGVGGVIVAGLNILTLAVIPGDSIDAAFIFFIISVVVLFFCAVSFWLLEKLPIVHYYTVIKQPRRSSALLKGGHAHVQNLLEKEHVPTKTLLWQLSPMAVPCFLIYVISLALFPAVGVTVQSQFSGDKGTSGHYADTLFIPIYCFGGFALGDLIGRTLAPRILWPAAAKPWQMKWTAIIRIAFIPLMMMCNIQTGLGDNPDSSSIKPIFMSDAWPYAFMMIIGITNGYFSTLCMMYGPMLVDKEERERAGFLMLLSLVLGLLMGSTSAFVILAILCKCNSFVSDASEATTMMPTTINGTDMFGYEF